MVLEHFTKNNEGDHVVLPETPIHILNGLDKMKNLDDLEKWVKEFGKEIGKTAADNALEVVSKYIRDRDANHSEKSFGDFESPYKIGDRPKRLADAMIFMHDMLVDAQSLQTVIESWEKENKMVVQTDEGPAQDILASLIIRVDKHFTPCPICGETLPASQFPRLGCGHHNCIVCLRLMAKVKAIGGNDIICPGRVTVGDSDRDCGEKIPDDLCRELLGSDPYARWVKLKSKKASQRFGDDMRCARCTCICSNVDGLLRCPKCGPLCRECMDLFHEDACLPINRRIAGVKAKIDAQRRAAKRGGNDASEGQNLRNYLTYLQNVEALMSMHKKNTKRCPRCAADIEREGGCPKITCPFCKHYFCFRCLRPLDKNHGIKQCEAYRKGKH